MKIKLINHRQRASTVLTMFLLVGCCALLIAGGCVANSVRKKAQKLKERRDEQLSNVLSEAKADLIHMQEEGGGQIFSLTLAGPSKTEDPVVVLQATTNLIDWEDAGTADNFGPLLAEGYTNGVPAKFFRLHLIP